MYILVDELFFLISFMYILELILLIQIWRDESNYFKNHK